MNGSQNQYSEWKKPYRENTYCMIPYGVLEQAELIYDDKNHYSIVATVVDVAVGTEERGKREISGIISW